MPLAVPTHPARLPHWTTPGIRVRIARPAPPPPSETEMDRLHPVDPLPPEYRARYRMILADLDAGREVDRTTVTPARLMLAYERTLAALSDATDLIDDLAADQQAS